MSFNMTPMLPKVHTAKPNTEMSVMYMWSPVMQCQSGSCIQRGWYTSLTGSSPHGLSSSISAPSPHCNFWSKNPRHWIMSRKRSVYWGQLKNKLQKSTGKSPSMNSQKSQPILKKPISMAVAASSWWASFALERINGLTSAS
jgi:hypothetical protein